MKKIAPKSQLTEESFWNKTNYEIFLRSQQSDNADYIMDLSKILNKAIEEYLTEKQKDYLKLYYYEGLKQCEIAKIYGVEKSTVSRVIANAKRKIKKVVGLYF
ncbi:MAG: sigma-70 family RNA polymerase sigma factor [Eubacteriales bacterium]